VPQAFHGSRRGIRRQDRLPGCLMGKETPHGKFTSSAGMEF
jgi:hypothetical protein